MITKLGMLEVADLKKSYGALQVLNEVSFAVNPGEFVTLLGPSGSGKTTTLKIIAGLDRASGGAVRVDGRDITFLPARLRNLGLVFQQYALFPHMTVAQNIAYPLTIRRVAKVEKDSRVEELLKIASLDGLGHRRPSELSGGQQQRVALMRALAHRPPVVLLDEPLGALDRNLREQMQSELKRIQKDMGVTMIYVTHDQDEALSLSDRIVVMTGGRIEQIGAPAEIYRHPETAFVAKFIGAGNLLSGTVSSIDAESGFGSVAIENLGTLRSRMSPVVRKGHSVYFFFRPEHARIRSDLPQPHGNALPVVDLKPKAYLGNITRYEARLKSGALIELEVHDSSAPSDLAGHHKQNELWLEIPDHLSVILPNSATP